MAAELDPTAGGASRPTLSTYTLLAALLLSIGLNFVQFAGSESEGRRLDQSPTIALSNQTYDCASVACPSLFTPVPAVDTGKSTMVPFLVDTRFKLHGPSSMLELTRLLYGQSARLGEPFLEFTNPFGRRANLKYDWTQISEEKLEAAWRLLPNRGRNAKLVVEVGSFVGKSSALIGHWLRKREAQTGTPAPPLLCIDTWLGDLGMLLGQTYPQEMGKRFGHPTLYHVWMLNMLARNLTAHVLPLVASSLLGARTLDFLRLAVDVVYLDSAHEQRETFMELTAYWPLLRPGGMLLGDDFNWRAVSHDVQLFARTRGLAVGSFDGCHTGLLTAKKAGLCVWYLRKPFEEKLRGIVDRRPTLREYVRGQWRDGKIQEEVG